MPAVSGDCEASIWADNWLGVPSRQDALAPFGGNFGVRVGA